MLRAFFDDRKSATNDGETIGTARTKEREDEETNIGGDFKAKLNALEQLQSNLMELYRQPFAFGLSTHLSIHLARVQDGFINAFDGNLGSRALWALSTPATGKSPIFSRPS